MPRTGKRRWPKPPPCLPDSAHRWRLETPNGPTVLGVCAHCHAEHAFPLLRRRGLGVEERHPHARRAPRPRPQGQRRFASMSTATTDARFAAAMAAMCWGKPSPAEASAIRARQKREATARMRARRLSEGSCTTCGGFVEDCSSECAGCRAKRRERRLRSNSPGMLPRRARWIAEGLCSGCGSAEEREGRAPLRQVPRQREGVDAKVAGHCRAGQVYRLRRAGRWAQALLPEVLEVGVADAPPANSEGRGPRALARHATRGRFDAAATSGGQVGVVRAACWTHREARQPSP